jgi:hypothetical protein
MSAAALETHARGIESRHQEQTMFSTPEIYLQAELEYHRDEIRRSFRGSRLQRQGTPVRRRPHGRLGRHPTAAAPVSR